jgi:hypothetical protein
MLLSLFACSICLLHAANLQTLREDSALTPERFASFFAEFEFEALEHLQRPETFLATRRGDCDDYAVLASWVLQEKGYATKLVVVFMPKDIHVVCYVKETGTYLDFNNRRLSTRTVPTDGTLADIADKVARSFGAGWYCVSEFVVERGRRRLIDTDFPRIAQLANRPAKASFSDAKLAEN